MKTVTGTPKSRDHTGARAPLMSHATARPRHAGTPSESQPPPAAGRRKSKAKPTRTSQHYEPGSLPSSPGPQRLPTIGRDCAHVVAGDRPRSVTTKRPSPPPPVRLPAPSPAGITAGEAGSHSLVPRGRRCKDLHAVMRVLVLVQLWVSADSCPARRAGPSRAAPIRRSSISAAGPQRRPGRAGTLELAGVVPGQRAGPGPLQP
jgi:hypothetical protein